MRQEDQETLENDQLIVEFLGYKLKPCNNGRAWERPTLSSIHDTLNLHGRLWRQNDPYYKFNSDWNWLMSVLKKISETLFSDYAEVVWSQWVMIFSPTKYPLENVYNQAVEFIKWHNQQKK
jgi:hypothetical protein